MNTAKEAHELLKRASHALRDSGIIRRNRIADEIDAHLKEPGQEAAYHCPTCNGEIDHWLAGHLAKEPVQDERKALAEDAARYRLLRDTANWDVLPVDEGADRAEWRCLFHSPYGMRHEADDDLDCALDALAAEQEAQASGRARSPAKTVGYLRRHPEPVQDERKAQYAEAFDAIERGAAILTRACDEAVERLAALPQPAEKAQDERKVLTEECLRKATKYADIRIMATRDRASAADVNDAEYQLIEDINRLATLPQPAEVPSAVRKAVIDFLCAVDEQHDTKGLPLKYTVPWGALNALREAIGATPLQPNGDKP